MLQVIRILVVSMRRGGLVLDAFPKRITDPQWRAEAIVAFGSSRTADGYAAALATRSAAQLWEASRQMDTLPVLYAALNEALRRLAEAELE